MKIVNTNDENSFDPTPILKSSPIPIKFISFNKNDENCIYCGEKYIMTLLCWQKYCQKCLSSYINDINDNNIYLDVYIYTMDLECNKHEISRTKVPQSIQECCGNCVKILCFKQIDGFSISNYGSDKNIFTLRNKVIESEKKCKLCGKSLYQGTDGWKMAEFKLCSDCYLISSELIESTLVKKQISILYLPWWYNNHNCDACRSKLTFTSECQKYCAYCYIFYVGCRHCLTTNIIFGPIVQSHCKKCKKISVIINSSVKSDIDDFLLYNVILDNLDKSRTCRYRKKREYFKPWNVIFNLKGKISGNKIKWIPYSQFTGIEEIAKGGYGIIYKAILLNKDDISYPNKNETVILKRFENSKNISKYFFNELKSHQNYFSRYFLSHIIETYGFTKDPELEDYILVIRYASGGDLHKYLQKDFTKITWNKQKLDILWQISKGLETIHDKKVMHRDFHSGNILFDSDYKWKIGDLGLLQAVNNISSNNEIYGVIPYIAPEIFKGSKFTKEADIYSLGMIMWELTT
ncbi:kinase-like protein, partial [Rhizophagus irregularis]